MASPPLALFLFTIFINFACFATAQNDLLKYFCINGTGFYQNNSVYQTNLNTLLSSLSTNIDSYGFYNSSLGQGSDAAHALALCRGDVNPDACRICVDESVGNLTHLCPNNKEAIIWYDYCMVRYSNKTMFGIRSDRDWFNMWNMNNVSSSETEPFNKALRTMMDTLKVEAANGGARRKFATGNVSFANATSIYGLVQCTPDLSMEDCSGCLSSAIEKLPDCCNGRIGGRVIKSSCNFRYELNPFFNATVTLPQGLAPPPHTLSLPPGPPPTSPSSVPPPTSSGKSDNKITIIIHVVASAIGSLILL